jgi:hypothetical protein
MRALVILLVLAPAVARAEWTPCADAPAGCVFRDRVTLGGLEGVQVELDVLASAPHVWKLVGDCPLWASWFPHVRSCRAGANGTYRVVLELDGHRYDVTCAAEGTPGELIRFHRVGGDMRALEGEWRLQAVGSDRTRVRYTLAADVGWYAPMNMVRARLQIALGDIVRGLTRWSTNRVAAR